VCGVACLAAVLALLLETTHPHLAKEVIYVAGDRVVTDPLCQPFSMGRNLWCIYSKKHINDDPETVADKRNWNIETLRRMKKELSKVGDCCQQLAPSKLSLRNTQYYVICTYASIALQTMLYVFKGLVFGWNRW
jgi:hypothetical protein